MATNGLNDYGNTGRQTVLDKNDNRFFNFENFVSDLTKELKKSVSNESKALNEALKKGGSEYEKQIKSGTTFAIKAASQSVVKMYKDLEETGKKLTKAQKKVFEDANRNLALSSQKITDAEARLQAINTGDVSKFVDSKQSDKNLKRIADQVERQNKFFELERQRQVAKDQQELDRIDTEEKKLIAAQQSDDFNNDFKETLKGLPAKLSKALLDGLSKFTDNVVKDAVSIIDQYSTGITTRLLGTEKTWDSMLTKFRNNLGLSPIVSEKQALDNLNKLVSEGIAYNVEQRAFLATMTENIATTFNAFDSSLMRIIRLQQTDSTVARMGMEATLNQMLNYLYGDTSYLNSLSDSVGASIFEATSQLSKTEAVDTEFQIQKWLGAMSSVGVSDEAINAIASALGMLGSGDVFKLQGTPMQTLLVESMGGDIAYADLLTEGLNSSNVNTLMKQMVNYLQTIAEESEANNVVRRAYGNVFGLSSSDLQAIKNLSATADQLAGYKYNYDNFESTTSNLAGNAITRTYITKMLSTIGSNISLNTGIDIVRDPLTYLLYSAADLSENLTGGITIPIPGISGLTIEGLVKAGVGGTKLITSLLQSAVMGVANLIGGGPLGLWGATDTWKGGGLTNASGLTGSLFGNINTGGGNDMMNGLVEDKANSDETKQGKDFSKKVSGKDINDIYQALTNGSKNYLLDSVENSMANVRNNTETLVRNTSEGNDTSYRKLREISSSLSKLVDENSGLLRVSLQQIGATDMSNFEGSGLPVTLSDTGVEQLKINLTDKLLKTFGWNENATTTQKKRTLQDLIDFFMSTVGEDDGLNVHITSIGDDVTMSRLLGNEKYSQYSRGSF